MNKKLIKICGILRNTDKIDYKVRDKIVKHFYNLEFQEKLENNTIDSNFWDIIQKSSAAWSKYMGGVPEILENNIDGKFIRFNCIKDNNTYLTSGIKSKVAYGDGKFECEARFYSGDSTWPSIWMIHPRTGYSQKELINYGKYYEIDLSEYYEKRNSTSTTYHSPESMMNSNKRITTHTNININGWNKFVCEWNNDSITVYINDKIVLKINNDKNPSHYPILEKDRTFNFILSMQYENSYLNPPNEQELPLYMDVRNIKYYKFK